MKRAYGDFVSMKSFSSKQGKKKGKYEVGRAIRRAIIYERGNEAGSALIFHRLQHDVYGRVQN